MPSNRETARITITRYITDDGQDLVYVDSDNLDGATIGVVEALGLLRLAEHDVCHRPADDGTPDDADDSEETT